MICFYLLCLVRPCVNTLVHFSTVAIADSHVRRPRFGIQLKVSYSVVNRSGISAEKKKLLKFFLVIEP